MGGALRRGLCAVKADGRWPLLAVGALLLAAVVALAPAWWIQAAGTVASSMGQFWVPAGLAAAGLAVLIVWYRRWRAVPRPARPVPVARRWPLFGHVSVLLLTGILSAAGIGALLWWALGSPTLNTVPATSALTPAPDAAPGGARPAGWSVQNTFDAIKIVLSLVAGIGAVVALTVAYRKQDHSEAAEHREDTKLFTERFTKASEQLGSDQAAVRLAGVYALAGLADDWKDGRQTCIEVLCAYMRMPYTPPADDTSTYSITATAAPASRLLRRTTEALTRAVTALRTTAQTGEDADKEAERRQERQVRHTILDIIGEHLRPPGQQHPGPRWHGHRFNLSGAVIDGGNLSVIDVPAGTQLNFRGATFCGNDVAFGGATFSGGWVSFFNATFTGGEVSFFNATFSVGEVSFNGATFSGGTVSFFAATFSGGEVYFTATFSGGTVSFFGATFSGGTVSFSHATFSGGTVSFPRATFSGGEVNMSQPALWQSPPEGVDASTRGVQWPSAEYLAGLPSDSRSGFRYEQVTSRRGMWS